MPRIDRITINPNLATAPTTKVRKKENESINAETNTDPWQPPCQSCLQRQNSQFVFENNTIDMNEYIKAINYINSIHSLINETLLSKPGQGLGRNSPLNLKANISMPDLPNFLTLLSGINNFNNNVNTNCSNMVSRTTSTSTLSNTLTIIHKPDEELEKNENCLLKCNECNKEDDSEHPNSKDLLDTNLEEINGQGDQGPQSADEEIPDSEVYPELGLKQECSKTETYYVEQNLECNCKHCSNSSLQYSVDNDTTATTPSIKEEISLEQEEKLEYYYKQALQSKALERQQKQNIDLERKKATPEIPSSYLVTTKSKDNFSCERKKPSDENRARHDPMLSEAELDRYASELLIGVDWESCDNSIKSGDTSFTFTVPVAKHISAEKVIKTIKSRLPQAPSPEPVRRKAIQKTKEGPPHIKQKSFTQIPVKQNVRPTTPTTKRCGSRSCSPVKNRHSNSTSPIRPGSPNFSNRRHLKNEAHVHFDERCNSVHNDKQESVKTFRPASSAKPKMLNFQVPSLTALEKSKISPKHNNVQTNSQSNTASTLHNHVAFQSQKKSHEGNAKKGMVTYKVQQKEDDDFICSRKAFRTHLLRKSSDSVIFSDKEDRGIITYTDSDIHDDLCDVNRNPNKAFTFQSKPSRNDLENSLQNVERSNERFVVSIPTRRKRDTRKQPFRQARRQSGDSEEIVHIRNYITPCKHMNDSDTNSNDTNSSDIKSDKESLPSQQVFKI